MMYYNNEFSLKKTAFKVTSLCIKVTSRIYNYLLFLYINLNAKQLFDNFRLLWLEINEQ